MNFTANFNLNMPLSNEKYSIDVFNENVEKIDAELNRVNLEMDKQNSSLTELSNDISAHAADTGNPHKVTKSQVGLGNVTNNKQIKGNSSGTTDGNVPLWGTDGYTLKDSGCVLEQSVTKDSKLTDTVYVHPSNDGNRHVPATGTTNSGKFLKAGGYPASEKWDDLTAHDVVTALNYTPAEEYHNHKIADITGLQTELDSKALKSHFHVINDVTGLQAALDSKASYSHTHTIANITNLQSSLDGKAATSHAHTIANVTNLQSSLDNKADKTHTHSTYMPITGGTFTGNAIAAQTSNTNTPMLRNIYISNSVPTTLKPGDICFVCEE